MLKYYTYRLPFKKPFSVFGNEYEYREGIVLVYTEGDIMAFGEVAPLPGFSEETLSQVEDVLKMNRSTLELSLQNDTANQMLEVLEKIHGFPSLSFGLDSLIHDLAAKKANITLHEFLFKKKNPSGVSANATLSFQDEKKALKNAEVLIKKGFNTLKVKLGQDFDRELQLLKKLRHQFPHVKIRIDANQAWEVEEAIYHLKKMDTLKIEYCEQPISKENFEGLRNVKKTTTIPIAADESVRNKTDAFRLSKAGIVDVLILKPTLLGSFKNIFVTKSMASSHNIKVVFTTGMESAIARSAIAVLSSGLGDSDFAQGLATGIFFKHDVGRNSWIDESIVQFPNSPGLGVSVDFKLLEEIQE
ncbi:MAG: o-succinylbenzoate synthase [Balneolaceae bacterium]